MRYVLLALGILALAMGEAFLKTNQPLLALITSVTAVVMVGVSLLFQVLVYRRANKQRARLGRTHDYLDPTHKTRRASEDKW